MHRRLTAFVIVSAITGASFAATGEDVQARIDADVAVGRPVVVHVVVALCDNASQGIVPVSASLGNGQNPRTNLYWGALYGVRTHLTRAAGWATLPSPRPEDRRILERIVLRDEVERGNQTVVVYIVADAWDGARIRSAMRSYFEMTAGRAVESVTVTRGEETLALQAGGASHLVAFIGHNGLMEFSLEPLASPSPTGEQPPARGAMALACASKPHFLDRLRTAEAHPLLLTTGLMAPEAYTLDATIRSWIADGTTAAVTEEAARAYDRYQKCGLAAAQRLFWGQP